MADIRINALATTATTPASDDYLALDGTAQGTRKILATNIANNVTDVILGTSGPSVKSTLSARAPRQGLVFDGTGNAATMTVGAFGATGWSIAATFRVNAIGSSQTIIAGSTAPTPVIYVSSAGKIVLSNAFTDKVTGSTTLVANKNYHLVVVGNGTTSSIYLDGISDASGNDTTNYSNGLTQAGNFASALPFAGEISIIGAYNRALSASEVVSLYEAGAPAGADYNSASNTAINSSAFTNFNYDTFSSASATGFTAVNTSGTTEYAQGNPVSITGLKYGNVIRVTYSLTLNSGQLPQVVLGNIGTETHSAFYSLTAGSNQTVDIVVSTNSGTSTNIAFRSTAASNYSISSVSARRIGLLLAPDAAQAGGGLVWYDTSGNAANITLPASGVSWNVPSSSYWGGTLNLAGSTNYLKISTTGTPTSGAAALQLSFNGTNSRGIRLTNVDTGGRTYDIIAGGGGDAASFGLYDDTSGAYRMFIASSGNLLIGTTTDGGQKLQVSGTGYFSGNLIVGSGSGTIRLAAGDGSKGQYTTDGTNTYFDYIGSIAIRSLPTYNTALTLDSSQNATFAGNVVLGAGKRVAYSASAYMTPENNVDGAEIASPGQFTVKTASTQALKIDSSQNATFAGTVTTSTTNSSQSAGNGNKLISSGAVFVVNAGSADGFSYYNSSAAAYRFYVDSGGTISATNTAISAISDARLKENVRDLSGGLSSILALKPRVFDWKEGKGANKKNVRGFIAQEIEQVFPDLVDEWKDAAPEGEAPYKSVRQDLIPVLVKAIQELTARVVALENA